MDERLNFAALKAVWISIELSAKAIKKHVAPMYVIPTRVYYSAFY